MNTVEMNCRSQSLSAVSSTPVAWWDYRGCGVTGHNFVERAASSFVESEAVFDG